MKVNRLPVEPPASSAHHNSVLRMISEPIVPRQIAHPLLFLSEIQHPVKIAYSLYDRYLKADNMIRTTAICKVTDEAEVVVERDVILDNPTLTLEVRGCGECLPQTPGVSGKD